MTHTPTDIDGNPYTPTLNYGWLTDAHRATCALHMACDPSQIEYRLDARAKMAARYRAEKVAKLLAEAVSEIGKMTETERDAFDLDTSADPLTLDYLSATLETAATGLHRAADGLALGRATDETKRTAMASRAARRDLTEPDKEEP